MIADKIYKISLLQDISKNPLTSGFIVNTSPEEHAVLLEEAAKLAAGSKVSSGGFVESIFSSLIIDGKSAPRKMFFPTQAMTLQANYFPQESPDAQTERLTGFQADFNKLNAATLSDRAYAETLLHVLHKYASSIPSGHGADVSLYDYAKSKAGIAVCLWRAQTDSLQTDEVRNSDMPILFVGGGIGGIQEFIYDIIGANAAKNLKGRSYYLHLLVDSVVRRLIYKLDLFNCNVVTSSGGNFYLLAPNTTALKDKLSVVKEEIEQAIFEKYKIALSLELEFTEVPNTGNAEIGTAFKKLNNKISASKKRKHYSRMLDKGGYDFFFSASEIGGEEQRDTITGNELSPGEERYIIEGPIPEPITSEYDGTNVISRDTAQQIFLGKALRDCGIRFSTHDHAAAAIGTIRSVEDEFQPGGLDEFHYIVDNKHRAKLSLSNLRADFLAINDLEDFSSQLGKISKNPEAVHGFELYGGNEFPYIQVESRTSFTLEVVKTFSELAGMSDEAPKNQERIYTEKFKEVKFKRLAVLRMDVDNLGYIFQNAFAKDATFARYYALSRQLDWFFKGYLNTLWKQGSTSTPHGKIYHWKDHVQITYSGGDDLFIVGKWNCVMEFAVQIRKDFKAWTCQHPAFDISGGITVVTPKFPIYAAAKQCEKDEKRAKKHHYPLKDDLLPGEKIEGTRTQKQSFTLFGTPLNWQYEFLLVSYLRDEITKYFNDNRISVNVLIQQIQYFEELSELQKRNKKTETWRWQLAYQLQRAADRYNLHSESFFEELKQGVFFNKNSQTEKFGWTRDPKSSRSFLNLLSLAARWAEFEHRYIEREEKEGEIS